MDQSVQVRCKCGEVRGVVNDPSPRTVNRVTCYCDDCQAFVHQLGRADLLNAKGGSDIIQVAPAALSFTQGQHHIVGLRLKPNGLYRWYARCCNTPVGNTLTPSIPFVGLLAQAFDEPRLDDVVGAPMGSIFGKFATGDPPAGSKGLNVPLLVRVLGKVLGWRLRRRAWPHPFFSQETGTPLFTVTVLSQDQRKALQAVCGPRAGVPSAS